MDYHSPFWGPEAISIVVEPKDALTCRSSTLAVLADSGPLHALLLTISGSRVISMVIELQGALTCRTSTITVWADCGLFLGLLLYFGVSESFPRLTNPGVRLRVGHKHSQFGPILVRFVDYYSPFWGPRAISSTYDPRDAFTCPSSTLTVLANSDPLRGLLLTVLGCRSDFHSC